MRSDDDEFRTERDLLGEVAVPAAALYGVHTLRALENFALAGRPVHAELVHAYGAVKLACALHQPRPRRVGRRPAEGRRHRARLPRDGRRPARRPRRRRRPAGRRRHLDQHERQRGARQPRAASSSARRCGDYERVSPLDDLNLHQSTNDTYPTALRLAAIRLLHELEAQVVALQEAFQAKEKRVRRTWSRSAARSPGRRADHAGREMGAYAEAFTRDRWRIYKCEERLRVVNLGGTAIGTGLAAPRQFIFRVVEQLRELTGLGFARAENLVEATQNADVFVEVSGILKACAVDSAQDLPATCGCCPPGPRPASARSACRARQAGSSIMPGKVNPVIPEAVSQAAHAGHGPRPGDHRRRGAAAASSSTPFLPLIADCLLDSLDLLTGACRTSAPRTASRASRPTRSAAARTSRPRRRRRRRWSPGSATTRPASSCAGRTESGRSVRETVLDDGLLTAEQFDELLSAEAVCRLGMPGTPRSGGRGVSHARRPQGHAPAHRPLRPPQRRQVERCSTPSRARTSRSSPTWPARPPTRSRSRWNCCRSARCCSSTRPASTTSARSASCARRRTRQVFDRTDLGVLVAEAGEWGEFEEMILAEFRERNIAGRRRLQQDRPRPARRRLSSACATTA